jgi:magnesium transporter
MSIKAVGIAIKLTIEGLNQAGHFQTWLFATVSVACIIIQLVYLNKVQPLLLYYILSVIVLYVYLHLHAILNFQALDTFNTAVVSPIYYAMFTSLTILASAIMFKVR